MILKTTINIKLSQVDKIIFLAQQYNISLSCIINHLTKIAFKNLSYERCFMQKVRYQDRILNSNNKWRCQSVSFQDDVYERCLDMKKLYKLSVSRFIAEAIDKYLNQLIDELNQKICSDNYSPNYIIIHSKLDYYNHITIIWDMIGKEKLKKLQELHNYT